MQSEEHPPASPVDWKVCQVRPSSTPRPESFDYLKGDKSVSAQFWVQARHELMILTGLGPDEIEIAKAPEKAA